MKSSSRCRSAIAILALVLAAAGVAHGQGLPPLFVEPARAQDARLPPRAGVARARRVALRADLLAAAPGDAGAARALRAEPLPRCRARRIERERLERDGRGHVVVGRRASPATPRAPRRSRGTAATLVGGVVPAASPTTWPPAPAVHVDGERAPPARGPWNCRRGCRAGARLAPPRRATADRACGDRRCAGRLHGGGARARPAGRRSMEAAAWPTPSPSPTPPSSAAAWTAVLRAAGVVEVRYAEARAPDPSCRPRCDQPRGQRQRCRRSGAHGQRRRSRGPHHRPRWHRPAAAWRGWARRPMRPTA